MMKENFLTNKNIFCSFYLFEIFHVPKWRNW